MPVSRHLISMPNPGQSDNNGHSWVFYDNKNKKYWDIFRRTINIKGGDKYEPHEENPMMGYRGAARYIKEPKFM